MRVAKQTTLSPEEALRRAIAARTPLGRARLASKGLNVRGRIDRETQVMLMRQLYLAHFERRQFLRAREVAEAAVRLLEKKAPGTELLPEILHQDAARAAIAAGQLAEGTGHLRMAARRSPASRRSFHLWTLGSLQFLAGEYEQAMASFRRAIRWGTQDRPLYRAHLALSALAARIPIDDDLQTIIEELAQAPCGQGYGRFVLGHLAFAAQQWKAARRYLRAFVKGLEASRPLKAIALEPELLMSRRTLAKLADA